MITVPRYEEPQVALRPLPAARADASAPLEAFGGGASANAVSEATRGLGKTLEDIAHEEKTKADDVATQEAFAKTVQLRNSLMYDPEKGAMTKRGKDAFGVMNQYLPEFDKHADEIAKGLGNEDQRAMYQKLRLSQRTDLGDSLQKHTFSESQRYDEETTKAGVETMADDAINNYQDPKKVQQAIGMQEALIRSRGERIGSPSESIDLAVTQARSKTHASVIGRMLANDDVDQAKSYYEANKGAIGAGEITGVEKAIEEGTATQRGLTAWSKVSGLRLADGNPDEAKMQATIMADPALSSKEKEKTWDFVKAKAGEAIANKGRQDAARDRSFMNEAITGRKNAVPLEQALKLSQRYATDPYEQAVKEDAIKKLYSPAAVVTDPQTKVALWEAVQEGSSSKADIDRAFASNKLSATDWESLRQDYYKVTSEGKSPDMQRAHEQVKILAEQTFGSDKIKKDTFISEVQSQARGKSADEYQKIATDKAKDDPTTKHSFLGLFSFGGDQQYETDSKARAAQSLAFGKANQDLGTETVKAIGSSAQKRGAKSFTPGDIEAFSNDLGGYDKIKAGTPAHNAMQSLIRKNQLVTPANVRAVLAAHPDGNY